MEATAERPRAQGSSTDLRGTDQTTPQRRISVSGEPAIVPGSLEAAAVTTQRPASAQHGEIRRADPTLSASKRQQLLDSAAELAELPQAKPADPYADLSTFEQLQLGSKAAGGAELQASSGQVSTTQEPHKAAEDPRPSSPELAFVAHRPPNLLGRTALFTSTRQSERAPQSMMGPSQVEVRTDRELEMATPEQFKPLSARDLLLEVLGKKESTVGQLFRSERGVMVRRGLHAVSTGAGFAAGAMGGGMAAACPEPCLGLRAATWLAKAPSLPLNWIASALPWAPGSGRPNWSSVF